VASLCAAQHCLLYGSCGGGGVCLVAYLLSSVGWLSGRGAWAAGHVGGSSGGLLLIITYVQQLHIQACPRVATDVAVRKAWCVLGGGGNGPQVAGRPFDSKMMAPVSASPAVQVACSSLSDKSRMTVLQAHTHTHVVVPLHVAEAAGSSHGFGHGSLLWCGAFRREAPAGTNPRIQHCDGWHNV